MKTPSCRRSVLAPAFLVVSLALCSLLAAVTAPLTHAQKQDNVIRPGERWLDDRGIEIQAHGGGIIQLKDTWYWFGEDRSQNNDPAKRYVACYSSTDLVHWKYRHQVLALADPQNLGPKFAIERPKVYYNAKTKTYVMYMHIDDTGYKLASVAIATSKTVDGDYHFVKLFRPLGQESRDIGQFIDDDGSAYLIFEARPTRGFFIAKLSDDYMNVEKAMSFVNARLEEEHRPLQRHVLRHGIAPYGLAVQPGRLCHRAQSKRPVDYRAEHRPARDQYLRFPVDHAPQSRRKQDLHRDLYGRSLDA